MSGFKRNVLAGVAIVVLAALTIWPSSAAQVTRLTLELEDYAQMPITGELDGQNTRGQLARVNFLREEPGGRRFFVERPQRAALHPRQADEDLHDVPRLQRRSADGPACSRSSRSSAISPPASPTSSSIPTTRATACSTRFTWRTRPWPPRRRRGPASSPASTCRVHDDAERSRRPPWMGGSSVTSC